MKDLFSENKQKNTNQKILLEILKKIEELNQRVSRLENNETETESSETIHEEEQAETTNDGEKTYEEPRTETHTNEDNYIILGAPKGTERRNKSIQALQQDTLKEVTKNRKQIVKEKILSHTQHSRTSPLELKKIFVDRYKYCSKATFYRYLNELETEGKINYISINNTKYIYPLNEQIQTA